MKYLIELLIYVCLFIFVGCDDYNNIECDVSTSLLDKHKLLLMTITFKPHTVAVPVSVILSSVIAIFIKSMICLFVMWKIQISYKGTKSPIYDTPNTTNTQKQCLELKDNIAYGELHY